MFERLKSIHFSSRSAPAAIFLLCALAFGPLIGQLGFYWDDWPVIQTAYLKGDFWLYYTYNRPLSAWSHAFTAPFLGVSPLKWHLFAEVTWALIAVAFWWTLQQLWPARKRETLIMALLFAVHPIYLIHPIAVTFIQHNLTYIPFFISFGAMLAAMRQPQRIWLWTVIGVITTVIHAFSMEYFWGLELLRPVFIFLGLGEMMAVGRKRWVQLIKVWWPYLLALIAAIIWRMFFAQLAGGNPNELLLLESVAKNPVSGFFQLVQVATQDLVYLVVARWYDTFQPAWFDLGDRFGLLIWGLGGVTMLGFGVYFWRAEKQADDEMPTQFPFHRQLLGLGLFAMLAGGLSVWLAGRQLTVGLYADRFALPMLVGVVFVTVGLIEIIVQAGVKPVVYAILLGLSVTTQLRTQNDYRWDWVNQQRAFWQLYWRAPALAEHTTVFSDGTLFRYTGGYPTASALNVLYPQSDTDYEMDYWFLELDRGYFRYLPEMVGERYPIDADFRQYSFSSSSRESLVVYYAPDQGNCLWVMRETDQFNPDIPELTKEAVPISNLGQILPDNAGTSPDTTVFGDEPAHTWCYFYEKAELARQQEDWKEVARLAKESAKQGFKPNNRLEWLPFVEAYAHTGDWEQAMELSVDALNYSKTTRNLFCPVWRGFEREGLDAPAGTFEEIYEQLGCERGVED